jgi:hypothetical protein
MFCKGEAQHLMVFESHFPVMANGQRFQKMFPLNNIAIKSKDLQGFVLVLVFPGWFANVLQSIYVTDINLFINYIIYCFMPYLHIYYIILYTGFCALIQSFLHICRSFVDKKDGRLVGNLHMLFLSFRYRYNYVSNACITMT